MSQNDTSHQDAHEFETATSTTASNESAKTSKASPPFDDVRADVILRTVDNVDFCLFMTILRLASPIFNDMFSPPQPTDSKEDSKTEIPIVPVSETSTTLDTLLRLCYPINHPDLREQEMPLIGDVLRAALKYEIVVKNAREALKERLVRSEEDAFAGYAIACSLRLEVEAYAAATSCLRWPARYDTVPEIGLMAAWDYHNLRDFHRRAGEAVADLFVQSSFVKDMCSEIFNSTHICAPDSSRRRITFSDGSNALFRSWWVESMDELKSALVMAPRDTGKLSVSFMASKLMPLNNSRNMPMVCIDCAAQVCEEWDQRREKIVSAIEQEVRKVELKFSWK